MRITLLCNKDLASCVALNHLLPALQHHELTVFLSARVGSVVPEGYFPPALAQLKFYEQDLFNDIVFPLLDASHGHKSTRLHTFTGLSRLIGKPIAELSAVNQPDGLAVLAASTPDLILSIRFGLILKEAALAIPRLGVLNLHSGGLPEYKGVMATFRALLNGDTKLSTTLHWIDDSSIDTGRIVGTTSLQVTPGKSYLWHVLALYEDGCKSMAAAVEQLAAGSALQSQAQSKGGNYFTFPTESELGAFQDAGWRLVNPMEIEQVSKQFMG